MFVNFEVGLKVDIISTHIVLCLYSDTLMCILSMVFSIKIHFIYVMLIFKIQLLPFKVEFLIKDEGLSLSLLLFSLGISPYIPVRGYYYANFGFNINKKHLEPFNYILLLLVSSSF